MISKIKRMLLDCLHFWMAFGTKAFLNHAKDEILYRMQSSKFGKKLTVSQLLLHRFPTIQPISIVKVERQGHRLNVVTDSTGKESFFGGVATSLILATLFCNKFQLPLRIITRTAPNNPADYYAFLRLVGIKEPSRVEFYSDYDRLSIRRHYKLETSNNDIFLSTSWWSSEAVRKINLRPSFFYILQEVEPFFYAHGDDRLICERIFRAPGINYIINSKLLHDYLGKNGFGNVTEQGIYFEPAFPEHMYAPNKDAFQDKSKYRLFFYSRPKNLRNLFFSGLKLLDQALSLGIIDKDKWDIFLAGSDVPRIVFSNGVEPKILGQLEWSQYLKFTSTVDLGFCLMYSPHPSYPPLDLASSGAVVLTNTYENKQSLDNYSKNIICAHLDDESMAKGFESAVRLSKDIEQRRLNFLANRIERDWGKSFQDVLEYMYHNR
jgi:O-antigen biosynthesis protein